jgi:hypothetical protein
VVTAISSPDAAATSLPPCPVRVGEEAGKSEPRLLPGIGATLARFRGDGFFPAILVLTDRCGGFGLFRWQYPGAELETLAQSEIGWPASLTVIAASGDCQRLHLEERVRLQ